MEYQLSRDFKLPVYNIKAVAKMLGLLPVTLRAWERRYGLPSPSRGSQGYRLYSEYDLNILRWLKLQVDSGLSIGRAVGLMQELKSSGRDPAIQSSQIVSDFPQTLSTLSEQLKIALLNYDEIRADEILNRGFALFSIDQVLVEVVQSVLCQIGESWHAGDLPIAKEHFATHFFSQHLMSMLTNAIQPYHSGVVAAACAPGETHQVGLLIMAVMLRWWGWNVKYFGADLSLERFAEALLPLKPELILFSATRAENAARLKSMDEIIALFPEPRPLLVLGGQAFHEYRLHLKTQTFYLDDSPMVMVESIEKIMENLKTNQRRYHHE